MAEVKSLGSNETAGQLREVGNVEALGNAAAMRAVTRCAGE